MAETATAGVVENLVTQFSSALDCFRELVQNSLDSGTTRVEAWAEFQAGEGHMGTIAFHVDDFGEGMDENIIDNQLTQLFSSSKEDDLTKIGKFGIGFVSVFALEPRAVLVHTGRGGEYWEILFHEDRSFSKTQIEDPVEGTQITIFIEGDYHTYRELVSGVRDTLKKWCAHSETEITYEDRSPLGGEFPEIETINEPFEVQGDCLSRAEVPGTEIVMAYTQEPIYGFYNRGLTLAITEIGEQVFNERRTARYSQIAVKIKSRYLEHTLSRETVMRDENYEKAMALLDKAASETLLRKLVGEICEKVTLPEWGLAEMNRYATLMGYLMTEPAELLEELVEEPIFRTPLGGALSPSQIFQAFRADGRVLLSEKPTELTRELLDQKIPVILGSAPVGFGSEFEDTSGARHPLDIVARVVSRFLVIQKGKTVVGMVKRWLGRDTLSAILQSLSLPENVYLHVELDSKVPGESQELIESAFKALKSVDAGYKKLRTFSSASLEREPPFFVTGRKLSPLMALPPPGVDQGKKLEAAVNRNHQHFRALIKLYQRSPGLASYCLAKSLLLNQDRLLDRDADIMKLFV